MRFVSSTTSGLGALMVIASVVGCGTAKEAPLLVIIDVDTLRADSLGAYGGRAGASPALDRLAAESVLFEWAFSQAPNTPPSQTSLLTGLYPSAHGVRSAGDRADPSLRTIAEILQEQGFATAGFVDGGYMAPEFGLGQGFDVYQSFAQVGLEQIGPAALEWLDTLPKDRPAFLFLHTYDVHGPYEHPEPYRSMFAQGISGTSPGFDATHLELEEARKRSFSEGSLGLNPQDLQLARARYDGGVRRLDDLVDRFLQGLDERGLWDRALLFIVSDHGEAFGEHGFLFHSVLYAEVTHVPFLIRLPKGRGPRRISQVVQNVDMLPTALGLLGVPRPADLPNLHGRDLAPLVAGGRIRPRPAYAETTLLGGAWSLADEQYHMLRWNSRGGVAGITELYNYRTDRRQELDVWGSRSDDQVAGLEALGLRLRKSLNRVQQRSAPASVSSDTIEQLKALGYL